MIHIRDLSLSMVSWADKYVGHRRTRHHIIFCADAGVGVLMRTKIELDIIHLSDHDELHWVIDTLSIILLLIPFNQSSDSSQSLT